MRNKINNVMENGFTKGSLNNVSDKETKMPDENDPPRCNSAGAVSKLRLRELIKCSSAGAARTPCYPNERDIFKVPNGLKCSLRRNPLDDVISCEDRKRLVLHFDVRNTVLVHDSVTNIDVEQSLNSFLTGVVWGVETDTGGWEWRSTHPSLEPPSPECITYYKYMEKQLVKKPSDRAMLRRVTGDFTQENIGKQFNPYFKRHLELLRWKYEQEDKKLTMKGEDGNLYHYILPSFFKLLNFLHNTGREHSIIIRTYGLDAPNVLRAIEHTLQGNHPGFPQRIPHEVNVTPGRLTRNDGNSFKCEVIDNIQDQINREFYGHYSRRRSNQVRRSSSVCVASSDIYGDETEIYEMMCSVDGVCGFVDDFKYWQDHEYHHTSGKPLWVDLSDPSVHHIIFDDNIRVSDVDSIVDVRVLENPSDADNPVTWKSLESNQMEKLEDVCLVQADLLQSTENEEYFIEKLLKCERNYDQLLSEGL